MAVTEVRRESPARQTVVVGLLTDEGLPTRIVRSVAADLPGVLSEQLSRQVDWQVCTRSEPLHLDSDGNVPMGEIANKRLSENGWDVLVLVTDLPRRAGTQPIVSDYSSSRRVGLLSLPALGAVRLEGRTRNLLVHLLGHLLEERLGSDPDSPQHAAGGRLTQNLTHLLAPERHLPAEHDEEVDQHLALRGTRGRLKLLAGMVRDNRPWRLVPHLSGATAAAATTAAYGVVTSSFWNMSDALSVWRLVLINIAAIVAMSSWLLFYNHLWDQPTGHDQREKAVLYNASTVLTLLIGVACMYVILYVLSLAAAAVLIDSGYLESQLHHAAGIRQYATIVWLTSSVGIVVGALGSSFESEDAVRKATYSRREQERRQKNEARAQEQNQEQSQ